MSKSEPQDIAYSALRELARSRIVSPATRNRAKRAVEEVHKEAAQEMIRNLIESDDSSAAAD